VLNPALPRGSVSVKTAFGIAVLTLGIVLPLAALRPAPQAGTPDAKAGGKKKPSPVPAPAPEARPRGSAAPAAGDESSPAIAAAPQASTPESDQEPAEAP